MSEANKTSVAESTEYENCLDISEELERPELDRFFDGEVDLGEDKEWKKHWKGMPAFDQKNNPPYKQIYLNFRNQQDYEEFAKLVDQNLSDKTKSIWYPHLDKDANSLTRWIVEE